MFPFSRSLVVIARCSKTMLCPIRFNEIMPHSLNIQVANRFKTIRQLSTFGNSKQNPDHVAVSSPEIIADNSKSVNSNQILLEPDYNTITNGDKDLEHKLKVLMLEAEVLRQEGELVPPQSFMTTSMWKEMLQRDSRSARKKYLTYLFKISKTKEKKKLKQLEKQQEFEEKKPELLKKSLPIEEHACHYGLQHNNILIRVHDQTMNRTENNKLIQAMKFGEKIVIDCGYDQDMTKRENLNCAKQLMLLFAENRSHKDPYDVHYCNINKKSDMAQAFKKFIPTMDDLDFPINVHEKSYLELYPKERLVYLTPHCKQDMLEYNPDEIYIIGAIVDKINNEPLSLAKAKREGIKMMKFPLDKYLAWGAGSGKSLTLNQCVSILLDLKTTGNWEYALRHVPRRKLADDETFLKRQPYNKYKLSSFPRTQKKWSPRVHRDIVFNK